MDVALLDQRVTQLEIKTDRLADNTISRELHTAEYKSLEKRITVVEAQLKTIIMLTVSNLLALSGFLAWQVIAIS